MSSACHEWLTLKLISVQDVEKELEVQIGMKQEMELSMKMLEKDICEKQDALVELRQQLEDLRAINQQLSHKLQVSHFPYKNNTNKNNNIPRLCDWVSSYFCTYTD